MAITAEHVPPLPASVLNLDDKVRSNVFPWRGQFSPELVEALIATYAPHGCTMLDPFMGSGTVLVESARRGHAACGVEVNPAAYLLARVYRLCNIPHEHRLRLLDKAARLLDGAAPPVLPDLPLFRSSPQRTVGLSSLPSLSSQSDDLVQILLCALVVLSDTKMGRGGTSARVWSDLRRTVLELPFSPVPARPILGDARRLPLPDRSIRFVLSSPPYINVFNYHHNFRASVEALGWKPLVVAASEIGANRKFRQNRFLTVVQYCIDIALALVEMQRVCTQNGRIVLILGRESNVHKTPLYNGEIVEGLARNVVGLALDLKQQRVFTNRFGRRIYEDLLHLSLPDGEARITLEAVVEHARAFALDVLGDARTRVPADRRMFLDAAISHADTVGPSPLFDVQQAKGAV